MTDLLTIDFLERQLTDIIFVQRQLRERCDTLTTLRSPAGPAALVPASDPATSLEGRAPFNPLSGGRTIGPIEPEVCSDAQAPIATLLGSYKDDLAALRLAVLRLSVVMPWCWLWDAPPENHNNGYGKFYHGYAHRVIYQLIFGRALDSMQVDHLCNVRLCVNPAHLRLATPRENNARSFSPTSFNAKKTHCIHGPCLRCGKHDTAHWRWAPVSSVRAPPWTEPPTRAQGRDVMTARASAPPSSWTKIHFCIGGFFAVPDCGYCRVALALAKASRERIREQLRRCA